MNRKVGLAVGIAGAFVLVLFAAFYVDADVFQGRIFRESNVPANYGCLDKDGKDFYEKGVTYGLVGRQGFGEESDVCIGRNGLREYYCEGKEKEVQSMEYTCENGCYEGACKEEVSNVPGVLATNANDYFLENAGALDCGKSENQTFCNLYNNAKKYSGFGAYDLEFGDMVEISPFIFHWKSNGWYGGMQAVWVDSSGEALLIEELDFSPFGSLNFSAQDFEGVYMMTELAEVMDSNLTTFEFVNDNNSAIQWCENNGIDICGGSFSVQLSDEVETKSADLAVFTTEGFEDYGSHESKSFQACYDGVKSYLGLEPLFKPVIVRNIIGSQSGGCQAGGNMLVCTVTPSYAEFILDFENGNYVGPELESGNCIKAVAAHELTHVFVEGTPLEQRIWTEGLATYIELKDVFDAPVFECLENGYKLGFEEAPYHDLGSGEFNANVNHYTTAACVWDHIVVNYGEDKFLEVLAYADEMRYKAGDYKIVEDVLVPVLGSGILSELSDKFNYIDSIYERSF